MYHRWINFTKSVVIVCGHHGCGRHCRTPCRSPASARLDDHRLVILQHHVVVVVDVQHRHGTERRRHAARPRRQPRVDRVDQRLDDGVVGGVEVVGQVERTVAGAVERLVSGRRHDPVVPADLAEVDVHRPASAEVASTATVLSTSPGSRPPAALRVPPTALVDVDGPRPGCRRRGRQSPDRSAEVGRPAGSVGVVRHQVGSPAADDGRRGRPVHLRPDDDQTEILLRSSAPSGHDSTNNEFGPSAAGAASPGHLDRPLADQPQVSCPHGGVVHPADVVRQRSGDSVDGHQRRGAAVAAAVVVVGLDVEVQLCTVGGLSNRDIGQVEADARHLLRQKVSFRLFRRYLPTSVLWAYTFAHTCSIRIQLITECSLVDTVAHVSMYNASYRM